MTRTTDRGWMICNPSGHRGNSHWRDEALCVRHDPELFFPVSDSGPSRLQTERAKDICASCPVRVECLEWAIDGAISFGVFGGLSEAERKSLSRRRRSGVLAGRDLRRSAG